MELQAGHKEDQCQHRQSDDRGDAVLHGKTVDLGEQAHGRQRSLIGIDLHDICREVRDQLIRRSVLGLQVVLFQKRPYLSLQLRFIRCCIRDVFFFLAGKAVGDSGPYSCNDTLSGKYPVQHGGIDTRRRYIIIRVRPDLFQRIFGVVLVYKRQERVL